MAWIRKGKINIESNDKTWFVVPQHALQNKNMRKQYDKESYDYRKYKIYKAFN